MAVKVLTLRYAAQTLDVWPSALSVLLVEGKLTPADINGRRAVLYDAKFKRVEKARKAAA